MIEQNFRKQSRRDHTLAENGIVRLTETGACVAREEVGGRLLDRQIAGELRLPVAGLAEDREQDFLRVLDAPARPQEGAGTSQVHRTGVDGDIDVAPCTALPL